jgi:uncharacterized membrane-anchored protein YhcB (DUF1043 family)
MEFLKEIPEWLKIGIVAIISAALGFFGHRYFDILGKAKTRRNIAIRQLELLQDLLEESKRVLENQNIQAHELLKLIIKRYGDDVSKNLGMDETFYQTYDQMKNGEKELFHVIRGTTIHSVYQLNERLREWTDTHTAKQLIGQSTESVESFDKKLMQLRLHLNGWFAKYEAIIKTSGKRSLIYLHDDKNHGFGFPDNISKDIEEVLGNIKAGKKW